MNVDRAKRAFTDNTLFASTYLALFPRQQQHARIVWHPKRDREIEEAEVDGDVEDIVIEVPVQPTASLHLRQQPPRRSSQHSSDALRSTSSSLRARRRRLELNCLCMPCRKCLMSHVWRLIQSQRFTGFRHGQLSVHLFVRVTLQRRRWRHTSSVALFFCSCNFLTKTLCLSANVILRVSAL